MSNLTRWDPFREMLAMRNAMDHLFESSFFAPGTPWLQNVTWDLALDVSETNGEFLVKASLPGINPDDLEITYAQPPPLTCVQRTRPPRTLSVGQCLQAAAFETLHPALDGARIFVKQLGHFAAAVAASHKQQPVEPVIVARLLGASDLLSDRDAHHFGVRYRELTHGGIPEKNTTP